MDIFELIAIYEAENNRPPETINKLLDFYQKKYVTGIIDINSYRKIYYYLHCQGAISAHELTKNQSEE